MTRSSYADIVLAFVLATIAATLLAAALMAP